MSLTTVRSKQPRFDEIVEWVASQGIQPSDALHVTVMLEMGGWTDRRASLLGFEDLFALAEAVLQSIGTRFIASPTVIRKRLPWYRMVFRVLGLYLQGLTFTAPMLLCSYSVLMLKYSVWSYTGFSTEVATGIALGTLASFLVSGGFTQAVARRGLFYLSQNMYTLARRSMVQLLVVGAISTVVGFVLGAIFFFIVPVLPPSILKITGIYYLLLSAIWFGVGLLYVLKKYWYVLLSLALGILIVMFEITYTPLDMMTAQMIAMGFVALSTLLSGIVVMRSLERKDGASSAGIKAVMPRWSQISRSLAPYFIYGMLYFALLFTDRLMSWSVPGEFHPYVIWFLGDYELGLDWALWTLVLPIGVVEVYIHLMFDRIIDRQTVTPVDKIAQFNGSFGKDHVQMGGVVLFFGLCALGFTINVIRFLASLALVEVDPLATPVTRMVFYVAAPAFIFMAVGLQNALVLFSFNAPWPVVRSVSIGVVIGSVVSFLASRYGGHAYAAFGLLAGGVTFAVHSLHTTRLVLQRLDFHLMRSV